MISYHPKKLLVHEKSWQDPVTAEILDRLPDIRPSTIRNADMRLCDSGGESVPRSYSHDFCSKETLVLLHYAGRFLKNCQGSGAEICCNYLIASCGLGCHMECTYCILQSYLTNKALMVYTNIDDLMAEIRGTVDQSPKRMFRIGTGELADSLALDHITHFSRELVPFFASVPNAVLELKTKSVEIGNLEDLDHSGHTIVSWSLNSRRICRTEEPKAPSLDERLAAALKCREWGYRLGFHFDPLIYYEGWEPEYRDAVREIFQAVDPSRVAWISLGAIRFTPRLREFIQKKYPNSRVPRGEFVPGHHGKVRYFRPIREEMYRKMLSWIHQEAPGILVYLCMESGTVWERSFGNRPRDCEDLSDRLDACGLRG
jgi:spore photoproduct lyase